MSMTRSEYQELIEFLGKKFDAIDRRFDAIDRRFEAIDRRFDAIEERLTRVEVTQEQDRDLIKAVAEGVANVNERLDRFQEEVASEFRAVRSEMASGFSSVWVEFGRVREEMRQGFAEQSKRLEGLEDRFDRWAVRRN